MIDKDWSYTWKSGDLELTARIGLYVWMYQKGHIDCLIVEDANGCQIRPECRFFTDTATPEVLELFLSTKLFETSKCEDCGAKILFRESHYRRANQCDKCCIEGINDNMKELSVEWDKEDAQEAKNMKARGMTHKVDVWVHPADGDDKFITMFYTKKPSDAEVRHYLETEGSQILDDFKIKEL